MTTATMPETTAPTTTPAPVEAELASIFYKSAEPAAVPAPKDSVTPTPASETGTPATPPASAVSTETAKAESPAGTETKETKETKPEEKGHAAAARRLGQEAADLKREMAAMAEQNRVLQAKLDGTYQEPVKPTADEIEARAEFKGREASSRSIAEGLFGAEAVKAQVYDDASPYKTLVADKPWLHARVARHPQPTMEAMRVLQEQDFLKTYGDDPAQWVAKIEADLKPKLLDEFKKQVAVPMTGTKAPSVTEVRGSGGTPRERSLEDLFYGKAPAPV